MLGLWQGSTRTRTSNEVGNARGRAQSFVRSSLCPFRYDSRHAAKVAYAVSGASAGLRINSKAETFSNCTR